MKRALRLVLNENPQNSGSQPMAPSDDGLLDAYSAAVTAAVRRIMPTFLIPRPRAKKSRHDVQRAMMTSGVTSAMPSASAANQRQ